MKLKDMPVLFRTDGDDLADGQFLVYPSTFTRKPDSYGDVVAKNAFDDTIQQWKQSGNVMPIMYGHRMDDPDYNLGGAIDMGTDDHGWWVKGQFDMDSPKAAQVYRLVKGKRLSQLSFAFDVLDEGTVELDDGTTANELRKLKVYEASFVPVGANQDTSIVAVKSAADMLTAEVKAGRVISAKNESSLRESVSQITAAAESLNNVLSQLDGEKTNLDVDEASGNAKAKTEEPEQAKAEELKANPSVEAMSQLIHIYEQFAQKGDSQ